jgi:sugar O-acyltransferase (sialic acid O-acetyltransferase NeuD family)
MKNLIIIGAGGFGREVLTMAADNPCRGVDWEIKGFLDNRPGILDGFIQDANKVVQAMDFSEEHRRRYRRDYPVLGDPLTYEPQPDDVFLCALGAPADRIQYARPLLDKGAQFVRLVHPLASVSVFASIGLGSIIGAYVSLSPDCHIGQHVTITYGSVIGHDTHVGDWVEIGMHSLVSGNVHVDTAARIHPGSVISPGVRIGEHAVVAAGSVVFSKVKPHTTVLGNPARHFDWKPAENNNT